MRRDFIRLVTICHITYRLLRCLLAVVHVPRGGSLSTSCAPHPPAPRSPHSGAAVPTLGTAELLLHHLGEQRLAHERRHTRLGRMDEPDTRRGRRKNRRWGAPLVAAPWPNPAVHWKRRKNVVRDPIPATLNQVALRLAAW